MRIATIVLTGIACLALGGCGDDSSAGRGSDPQQRTTTSATTATTPGDEDIDSGPADSASGSVDAEAARAVAQRYIDAVDDGDSNAICDLLSDEGQRDFAEAAEGGCDADLAAWLRDEPETAGVFARIRVGDAVTDGDRATVILTVPGENAGVAHLERDDPAAEWKVTGIDG